MKVVVAYSSNLSVVVFRLKVCIVNSRVAVECCWWWCTTSANYQLFRRHSKCAESILYTETNIDWPRVRPEGWWLVWTSINCQCTLV